VTLTCRACCILTTFCFGLFGANVNAADYNLVTGAKAPYSNTEQTGFLDRIAVEAFRRLGHTATVNSLPAARAIRLVSDGGVDGDMQRIRGLDKTIPNLVMVPEPINVYEFSGFTFDKMLKSIDLTDLKNLKVGYLRGWKFYEMNISKEASSEIVDSPVQLFKMLEYKRIDVALFSRWSGLYWARSLAVDVNLIEPAFKKVDMYIYLNKKNANLAPQLAKVMKSMKLDGTYDKIFRQTLEDVSGS